MCKWQELVQRKMLSKAFVSFIKQTNSSPNSSPLPHIKQRPRIAIMHMKITWTNEHNVDASKYDAENEYQMYQKFSDHSNNLAVKEMSTPNVLTSVDDGDTTNTLTADMHTADDSSSLVIPEISETASLSSDVQILDKKELPLINDSVTSDRTMAITKLESMESSLIPTTKTILNHSLSSEVPLFSDIDVSALAEQTYCMNNLVSDIEMCNRKEEQQLRLSALLRKTNKKLNNRGADTADDTDDDGIQDIEFNMIPSHVESEDKIIITDYKKDKITNNLTLTSVDENQSFNEQYLLSSAPVGNVCNGGCSDEQKMRDKLRVEMKEELDKMREEYKNVLRKEVENVLRGEYAQQTLEMCEPLSKQNVQLIHQNNLLLKEKENNKKLMDDMRQRMMYCEQEAKKDNDIMQEKYDKLEKEIELHDAHMMEECEKKVMTMKYVMMEMNQMRMHLREQNEYYQTTIDNKSKWNIF